MTSSESPPTNGMITDRMASAELSAPITAAWAISTGDSARAGRPPIEVTLRFCQPRRRNFADGASA